MVNRRSRPPGSSSPPTPTHPPPAAGSLRDLELENLARFLRASVGLDPYRPSGGEWAASYRLDVVPVVPAVDVDAWIAWSLAGVPLLSRGQLPEYQRARDVAGRLVLVLAMGRTGGSLSSAARARARRGRYCGTTCDASACTRGRTRVGDLLAESSRTEPRAWCASPTRSKEAARPSSSGAREETRYSAGRGRSPRRRGPTPASTVTCTKRGSRSTHGRRPRPPVIRSARHCTSARPNPTVMMMASEQFATDEAELSITRTAPAPRESDHSARTTPPDPPRPERSRPQRRP